MTSASTWRSLAELPPWQRVGHLLSQRLLLRGTATQAVEADLLTLQIHLCPNQAMLPQRVHRKAPSQQLPRPLLVAPPQEHQLPLRVGLQVQTPTPGKGTPWRCPLDPRRRTLPVGRHVAGRLPLQPLQGVVMEACPHLGLPAAVEPLDGRLE